MTAETDTPPVVADLTDALGRRVTAELTHSGLLAVLTRTVDEGLRSGHPCLDRDNARELGLALVAWADEEPG